jgi:16S rRNA (uracil1498-N3)-methyltransferase
MRIPRIYTEQDLHEDLEFDLDQAPSNHIVKVLRMDAGRELILFNGKGGQYAATIAATTKKIATIVVGTFTNDNRESPLLSHLAVGISRGDRFDYVLQKACELGVTEITPLFTKRCEVKLNAERLQKRVAAWQKILISACEQCNRNTLPVLHAPATLINFLPTCTSELKLVLHHRAAKTLSELSRPASSAILIGPEGGLAQEEIEAAQEHGFQALVLGPRVMRTETAPIVALGNMQMLWGDF